MNMLENTALAVKRNLWRQDKGFIYHQTPEKIQIPEDFIDRHDPPLRPLDMAEILTTQDWTGLGQTEICRRLEKGDQCHGHLIDGEVVSLLWIASKTNFIRGVNLLITLGEREWYCYGVMTKPAARGQGLYKLAQSQIVDLARENMVQRLVAYVEAQNPIPQKTYERLGYQATPFLIARRVMGVRWGNHFDTRTGQIIPQIANGAEKHYDWI